MHNSKSASKFEYAGMLLILILAFILRTRHIQGSLWLDEIYTFKGSSLSLKESLSNVAYPLYFLFAHLAQYFGDTEALLRLPSVLSGLLGIGLLYVILKRIHSGAAGLFGALLLTLSSFHIHHSQEARFYALVVVTGTLMIVALARALEKGRFSDWALYSATCVLALMSHLFMALFVVTATMGGIASLLATKKLPDQRTKMLRVAYILASSGVSFVFIFIFAASYGGPPSSISAIPDWISQLAATQGALATNVVSEAETARWTFGLAEYRRVQEDLWDYGWAPRYLVLLALGAWGAARLLRKHPQMGAPILSCFFLAPLAMSIVDSPTYIHSRYFAVLLPLGIIAIAYGTFDLVHLVTVKLDERVGPYRIAVTRTVCLLGIFVLFCLVVPTSLASARNHRETKPDEYWRNDWKGAAQYIGNRYQARDVMVFLTPTSYLWEIIPPIDFYLERTLSNPTAMIASRRAYPGITKIDQLQSLIASHKDSNIWIISIPRREAALDTNLINHLDSIVEYKKSLRGVTVRVMGEPTHNLAPWGAFEEISRSVPQTSGLTLTDREEAFDGDHALRFNPAGATPCEISIPFAKSEHLLGGESSGIYTLSFHAKIQDIWPHPNIAEIGILGHVADGREFTRTFLHLQGTESWRQHIVSIDIQRDLTPEIVDWSFWVSIRECQGTIWLDNVQLEAKDHATPFIAGTRTR